MGNSGSLQAGDLKVASTSNIAPIYIIQQIGDPMNIEGFSI